MIKRLFDPANKVLTKSQLISAFDRELPGFKAQMQMSILKQHMHEHIPVHAQIAAVLVILFWEEEELNVLYIRRTVHEKDKHSGQISFPGGRWETDDGSLSKTAIRETIEETDIHLVEQDIIGILSPLYIPVSNYLVHPFVAYLDEIEGHSKQDDEIDEIISFPLIELLKLKIERKDMLVRKHLLKQVPYFDLHGRTLWGATAMMTNELCSVLRGLKLL